MFSQFRKVALGHFMRKRLFDALYSCSCSILEERLVGSAFSGSPLSMPFSNNPFQEPAKTKAKVRDKRTRKRNAATSLEPIQVGVVDMVPAAGTFLQ